MLKLFKHFFGIFVGIGIVFLMNQIQLFKIPYIQIILSSLIAVLFFLIVGIFAYHIRFKKGKFLLFLCFCFFALNVFADEPFSASGHFCAAAEEYSRKTFEAIQNNGVGDEPCSDKMRNTIREKLNALKLVPRIFTEKAEDQTKWTSFRTLPSWNEWVQTNFSTVSPMQREEMACTAVLNSMCSDYDVRHPSPLAKTVKQIMQKDAEKVGCWPCEMSFIILTVVKALSSYLSENMREAGTDILQIFIFLWLLYSVFQAVIFPSKGKSFIKDLGKMFLSSLLAFMLLFNINYLQTLYKDILAPILNVGLGVSAQIDEAIKRDVVSNNFAEGVYSDLRIQQTDLCGFSVDSSQTGINLWQSLSDTIFPDLLSNHSGLRLTEESTLITPELEIELLCMVQRTYNQFSPFVAIGQSLVSFSFADGETEEKLFIPTLRMWFVGVILVVLFSIFGFLVAFRIIDIFLRLGFVLILTPLFVATAVFPITRTFTMKGFAFLLNIISEFFGLTLAINFIIVLFETGIITKKVELIQMINAPYSKDYGEKLLDIIASDNTLSFFFLLLALFFFGNAILKSSTKLMNSIFGGEAPGANMVGGAALGMTQMAGKLGKKTWDVSSKFAKNAESYHKPSDKSMAYVAGRAFGRLRSGQNPLKDIPNPFRDDEKNTSAASPKRYFGQKVGDGVNNTTQRLAKGLDRIGVTTGQALQKTGIGAIIGVPLTIATKTLTTGIRAAGKIASVAVKAPGATVNAVKNTPKNLKNFGGKIISAPKNFYNNVKNAYNEGLNGKDKGK